MIYVSTALELTQVFLPEKTGHRWLFVGLGAWESCVRASAPVAFGAFLMRFKDGS